METPIMLIVTLVSARWTVQHLGAANAISSRGDRLHRYYAQVGSQFAVEVPLNKRLTIAAYWFSGNSSIGYVTPGVILKVTKVTRQLTWYRTYQLGNHHLTKGNHQ
jgi:hypothetical protein